MIIEFILRLLLGDDFVEDHHNEEDDETRRTNNNNNATTSTASSCVCRCCHHQNNIRFCSCSNGGNFESICQRLQDNDPTLTYVDLSQVYIDMNTFQEMFQRFAYGLAANTNLETLKIKGETANITLFMISSNNNNNNNNKRSSKSSSTKNLYYETQSKFRCGLAENKSIRNLDLSRKIHQICYTSKIEWLQLSLLKMPQLMVLNLSRCKISDDDLRMMLCKSTNNNNKNNNQLQDLNLSNNKIHNLLSSVTTILKLHPNLQTLNLSFNPILSLEKDENNNDNNNSESDIYGGSGSSSEIEDTTTSTTSSEDISSSFLFSLDISNIIQNIPNNNSRLAPSFPCATIRELLKATKLLTGLTYLNLSWNYIIGDEGLIAISQSLLRIRKVNLTKCNITAKGSCHLAKILATAYQQQQQLHGIDDVQSSSSSLTKLRELSLARNDLGDDGILPFFQYPTSIEKLDLRLTSFRGSNNNNNNNISNAISTNINIRDMKIGNYNPLSFNIKKDILFWIHDINASGIRQLVMSHDDDCYHHRNVSDDDGHHSQSVSEVSPISNGTSITTTTDPKPPPYNIWPYIMEKSTIKDLSSAIFYLLSQTPELMMTSPPQRRRMKQHYT